MVFFTYFCSMHLTYLGLCLMSWPTEGCSAGKAGQHRVARTSSLGPSRPEDCTQGGQCYLLSRADVWHAAVPPCRVHPGCRASCIALPGEATRNGDAGHQATNLCRGGRQPRLHQTWRGHYTPGSTLHWPIQGGGQAGQNFQAGDWWLAGDSVSGPPEASSGTGPCSVGRPSNPRTAAGRRTGLQTLTLQSATIFPGTPARFFVRPGWSQWSRSLAGGPCDGIYLLLYCAYSLWRKFNCVKIPQGDTNKSATRWGSLSAKGGIVPPSVFKELFMCADQIYFILHYFAAYFYL
jgi:hypothetical protein